MTSRYRTTRRWALLLAVAALACFGVLRAPTAAAQQEGDKALLERLRYPKTVILVRHAEKASDDPRDPNLSEQGVARAQELARMLEHAGVTHLYATEFRRTQQTLEPLSLLSGAAVQVVPARDPAAVLSAIEELPRNSVTVVAGHSNTIPALVGELAKGTEPFKLSEQDYDRMYVVTRVDSKGKSTLLEVRFGDR
jgi:broad specificity phosphatase PhoE